jgi:uncharacterized protein
MSLIRKPSVSIVIPARDEAMTVAGILRSLSRQDRISDCEVIVVDGMSSDETPSVAASFPFVHVVQSERGLARQMNYGAQLATADAVWFLHSDSTLPEKRTVDALLEALDDPKVVGGAFQFHLRGNDWYYRLVTLLVNLRSRVVGRAWGDQGIFVRTAVFRALGGFREMDGCEDLEFILRLKRQGVFRILRTRVETSARTWQRYGKIQTTFWHLQQLARYEWRRRTGRLKELEQPKLPLPATPLPGPATPPEPPAADKTPAGFRTNP